MFDYDLRVLCSYWATCDAAKPRYLPAVSVMLLGCATSVVDAGKVIRFSGLLTALARWSQELSSILYLDP